MKIGLFVTIETEASNDCAAFLAELKQQVRTARDAGFDSLWVPQHVLTGPDMRQFAASPISASSPAWPKACGSAQPCCCCRC